MELVFKDYHFFTVSLRLNFVEWLAKKQRLSEFSKDAKFMDKGYSWIPKTTSVSNNSSVVLSKLLK